MEKELINFLRVTSCLMIEKANSGHPGVALSLAPMAYSVYKNAFFDPADPEFLNRDRIVFSCGHASALIYSTLHLFGFDVTLDDLKNFRQLSSRTPGHPEVKVTSGVDASTGPLGQGVGMAVGMAIAEKFLRAKFERGTLSPVNHHTFCFVGDGDLMEGVALEAIALAGHLRLNKLILLYDKNDITIEGNLSIASSTQFANRFLSENWNVLNVLNGNDEREIETALSMAKKSDKPTIIISATKIGFKSALEGSATVHGKPLTTQQIEELRKNLNYFAPDYKIPENAKKLLNDFKENRQKKKEEYAQMMEEYSRKFPKEFKELLNFKDAFKFDFSSLLQKREKGGKRKVDTGNKQSFNGRNEGHDLINSLYEIFPNLLSASADLSPSTRTNFDYSGFFTASGPARNLAFGVREHAMGAVCSGISLHGGLRTICSTFLAFENYMAPSVRMCAMMENPVMFYFTHDSISVGEDGPSHQPIEQLATLRALPNLFVFRPCGEKELLAGFEIFFKNNLPLALIIARQVTTAVQDNFEKALLGGYEIYVPQKHDLTLIATGSEVALAIETAEILARENIFAKVVSMPCVELFLAQSQSYQNRVVDKTKSVFCMECSSDNIWFRFASSNENVFGMTAFGKSGKEKDVLEHFGFSAEKMAEKIKKQLKKQ